ncbi:putative phosphatase [Renibacterium salmoninarum ATCC 33209]|uniref:Putative phosphatase n=1 Tax=Renibacterium salmoninarum (strain ATCC 33209 / DSM 20767 / JCM 11484 / NBRC 15589 / NCIMB 2235) TaxID=288705 RepID=A9WT71_RENSM|nr:HAD-IA family hydrolase [Renibacterium salmoninarum]ABY24009.1 putative phosphatase [Renibacterium salmoninarum ATCC 33209]
MNTRVPEDIDRSSVGVLFDLDGTLVDPAGGITGGIAYALKGMGLPVPAEAVLNSMVGPKLAESLLKYTETDAAQLAKTIELYRVWYNEHGIAMSKPYPGMIELLAELKSRGIRLAVATQKPRTLAATVLAHHGYAPYFEFISGADDDESLLAANDGLPPKTKIVERALQELGNPATVVMVGDREHDVLGARANGLACLGVSWGFAADGELDAAGELCIVHSAEELGEEILRFATEGVTYGAL